MTTPALPMYRTQLLLQVFAALKNYETIAGSNLYAPGDWPTDPELGPAIQVGNRIEETKSSLQRGQPSFNTTVYITVYGRLARTIGRDALADIETLANQITQAVLTSEKLNGMIQQFVSVETTQEINSDSGLQVAQASVRFGLEFYESQEQFFMPVAPTDIKTIAVAVDLRNIFDANGQYVGSLVNTLFPGAVAAPPRTSGPDGRTEGFIEINSTP